MAILCTVYLRAKFNYAHADYKLTSNSKSVRDWPAPSCNRTLAGCRISSTGYHWDWEMAISHGYMGKRVAVASGTCVVKQINYHSCNNKDSLIGIDLGTQYWCVAVIKRKVACNLMCDDILMSRIMHWWKLQKLSDVKGTAKNHYLNTNSTVWHDYYNCGAIIDIMMWLKILT